MRPFLLLFLALTVMSCGSSGETFRVGPDGVAYQSSGAFILEGANVLDGMEWQLNRQLRFDFNHPVDPDSLGFGAIQIRPLHPQDQGSPVTGIFELDAARGGRSVLFRPACPIDDALMTGGFVPGGVEYEVYLPAKGQGFTVLRDTDGRPLTSGMRRTFRTPAWNQSLFLDTVATPAKATAVEFPEGFNLFGDTDPTITIQFDQAIDGRSSNLNTQNLQLLFAESEIGQPGEKVFPSDNRVPGRLVLLENCSVEGSRVAYQVTGVLPVNRRLRLSITQQFRDIGGQRNPSVLVLAEHATPTLRSFYNDPSVHPADLAVDEIQQGFENDAWVDYETPLQHPLARVGEGYVSAQFDFPGGFISPQADFRLKEGVSAEIFTDSQTVFTDSNNRSHVVQDGVLRVDDFHIEVGARLRGRGSNPLIIYAAGEVLIDGTLDVSGNNATVPTSLQSPQFVEGGAHGECGGGRGGDASQVGDKETLRAESGYGAFGLPRAGGGGGEGGFNAHTGFTNILGVNSVVVGGGGGGGFALTHNVAIRWAKWPLADKWIPFGVDNVGPDHNLARHPRMQAAFGVTPLNPDGFAVIGAEPGMRGAGGFDSDFFPAGIEHAPVGFEDLQVDPVVDAISVLDDPDYDPAWFSGDTPAFDFGDANLGPDGGIAGPSVFRYEPTLLHTSDDFWGIRRMEDGTVMRGELLAPWAGSGGGGGGDSMQVRLYDRDGDFIVEPLMSLYPVRPFAQSMQSGDHGWSNYRKGAGGGGGGGQCMIMAVGMIRFGADGKIMANGGIGMGGESVINTDKAVSGSGGGSGGHLILHSSTGLDLSKVDVGVANTPGQIGNLEPIENIQAFGGRRGWAAPLYSTTPESVSRRDGNATFAIGRGGAGANGVIQVHVPNPGTDILWHEDAQPGIEAYLAASPNGVATDRAEELLALFTAPSAYALLPLYADRTMVLSKWIDTGLAEVRRGEADDFPAYGHALLRLEGLDLSDGIALTDAQGKLQAQAPIASGHLDDVSFDAFSLRIPRASDHFDAMYLRLPSLLVGYDVLPNALTSGTFEIVDAKYDRGADRLTLTTAVGDSPMLFALDPAHPTWSVQPKFFRINSQGMKDSLPPSTAVTFEFQGADVDPIFEHQAGTPFGGVDHWVTDLAEIDGARFVRYRILFDSDAQDEGLRQSDMIFPELEYLKLPIVW
ncbi:MAG: hypothetical protein ACPG31_11855 [Planctomycetota bacterium]